jgi:archaellum biogenesis protein FlaJ (TadC family)
MKRIINVLGRIGTVLMSIGLAVAVIYSLPLLFGMSTKDPLLNTILVTVPAGLALTAVWLFYYRKDRSDNRATRGKGDISGQGRHG